jgi:hypothetical protein
VRPRLAASLIAATALLVTVTGPAWGRVPSVINGTPNPPLSSAAVYYETNDLECSGSLWRPTIVVTTADCVAAAPGQPAAQPGDIDLWPPGSNNESNPSPVSVTQIIYDPAYAQTTTDGDDIAFFILDAPLGATPITRLATQAEAEALSGTSTTQFQFVSYGQTVPGDSDAIPMSSIPVGMTTTPALPVYGGGVGVLHLAINGVTGPCGGDEGGPWMAQVGNELLLVAVDVTGYGGPCDPGESGHGEVAAVIAGQQGLVAQALAAAGLAPLAPVTTCMDSSGSPTCTPGVAYQFQFCLPGSAILIQQKTPGGWSTIATTTAVASSGCPAQARYLVNYYGVNAEGTGNYRALAPKQPGLRFPTNVQFTVTTTAP